MSTTSDLGQLERRAWQSYHQDGLMEIAFGAILVSTFFGSVADQYRYIAYALLLLIGPCLALGKRWITAPRMGAVEFGPSRKSRKVRVVLFIAALVACTALLPALLGGAQWLRDHPTVVSIGLGSMVFLSFAAIAYWLELRRIYAVGVLFGLAFMTTEWLDNPIPLLTAGMLVLLFGLWRLSQFVKANPIPPQA